MYILQDFLIFLYKNEDIFNETIELLPGIDFSVLYKQNISENTKNIFWKYLQLILFSIIPDTENSSSFGDTAKLFEEINEDEFKSKIEETIKEMENLFDLSGESMENKINLEDLPDVEEMHDHISGMLDGKLGQLAKEIAEETVGDLNLQDTDNIEGAFQKLLKNPGKLMSLVQNVGNKLDKKMNSGEIDQKELLEEATNLMGKMSSMPGMDNIQEMLSKMGMGGFGNLN